MFLSVSFLGVLVDIFIIVVWSAYVLHTDLYSRCEERTHN